MLVWNVMFVWIGHSCPTLLTLTLTLTLSLSSEAKGQTQVENQGQRCRTGVSGPHEQTHMADHSLDRKYDYRRMLPHYQKAGRAVFVTFCKGNRIPFIPEAKDAILYHCLYDHGKRYDLHAAVVMPDHVHLLLLSLRDEKGWPHSLPTILKALKDYVLRLQESFEDKLEYLRQNPVRRGLASKPEDYKCLWVEPTAGK
jgi:REP element-mobilizing transposase RayT